MKAKSTDNDTINPDEIKKQSEAIIIKAGGEILDWLPTREPTKTRSINEIIKRALVLNAMYELHMKAPKPIIKQWLSDNNLIDELTTTESSILNSPSDELTDEENVNLYWSLDALWAIVWATSLIEDLGFDQPIGDELASLSPNLKLNEGGHKYVDNMQLRSDKSLYEMRDLYYRVHWWVKEASRNDTVPDNISYGSVIERRKALEWIVDCEAEWECVDLAT